MVGNSNNNDDDAFDMITMMMLAILPTEKIFRLHIYSIHLF